MRRNRGIRFATESAGEMKGKRNAIGKIIAKILVRCKAVKSVCDIIYRHTSDLNVTKSRDAMKDLMVAMAYRCADCRRGTLNIAKELNASSYLREISKLGDYTFEPIKVLDFDIMQHKYLSPAQEMYVEKAQRSLLDSVESLGYAIRELRDYINADTPSEPGMAFPRNCTSILSGLVQDAKQLIAYANQFQKVKENLLAEHGRRKY